MRNLLLFVLLICSTFGISQITFSEDLAKTMLGKLQKGDSLTYYQCRATEASVQITTGTQQLETKSQAVSITEKFVIVRVGDAYTLKYFVSGMTALPNRKFSGLKMREKDYWNFTFKNKHELSPVEIFFLAGLEKIGRPTIEYDFTVSKYTTNQMIIRQRKNFEQLLLKDKLSISEALKL